MPSGTFSAPAGYRDSPARPLSAGEVVASAYAIRDELGRTDTGIVFDARDMVLDREVALKLAWRDPGTPALSTSVTRDVYAPDGKLLDHDTWYSSYRATPKLVRIGPPAKKKPKHPATTTTTTPSQPGQ